MLVGSLVMRVRETLQDVDDRDRYTDARIIEALNLGILDLRRLRPDAFIGRYSEPTYQIGTDQTLPFDLPEIYIPPLVAYAVGWIETADDEYADDGRAVAMMKKFATDLGV